jgi:hypothetical protein
MCIIFPEWWDIQANNSFKLPTIEILELTDTWSICLESGVPFVAILLALLLDIKECDTRSSN